MEVGHVIFVFWFTAQCDVEPFYMYDRSWGTCQVFNEHDCMIYTTWSLYSLKKKNVSCLQCRFLLLFRTMRIFHVNCQPTWDQRIVFFSTCFTKDDRGRSIEIDFRLKKEHTLDIQIPSQEVFGCLGINFLLNLHDFGFLLAISVLFGRRGCSHTNPKQDPVCEMTIQGFWWHGRTISWTTPNFNASSKSASLSSNKIRSWKGPAINGYPQGRIFQNLPLCELKELRKQTRKHYDMA